MKKQLFLFAFLMLAGAAFAQALEMKNGFISVEMESTTSPLGMWKKISQGEPNAIPTASGGVHLEFTGNNPGSGPPTSPLSFTFVPDITGTYRIAIRASKRLEGSPGDKCNDCYVKMSGAFTSGNPTFSTAILQGDNKVFGGEPHPAQGWATSMEPSGLGISAPLFNFTAGQAVTVTFSGRAQRFSPDFFIFYNINKWTREQVELTTDFYPGKDGPGVVVEDPTCFKKGILDTWDLTMPVGYLAVVGKETARSGFSINTIQQPKNEWAAAKTPFTRRDSIYNVILTTTLETDGECFYRVLVNGANVLEFQNPRILNTTTANYSPYTVGVRNVAIPANATIQVDCKSNSNGLVAEGTGFAWARGRWKSISIGECADVTVNKWINNNPEDFDGDGILNGVDNCPNTANANQADADGDGKGDVCDNCPATANADQADTDKDGKGDVCDNCPTTANTDQKDADGDNIGDVCDTDSDNDGIANAVDNCPNTANPDQLDTDGDGKGDVCDNCPTTVNADQKDVDGDKIGDACDDDNDNDGVLNAVDNCPLTPNADQKDTDGNGKGDACEIPVVNYIPGSTITYYAEGKDATTHEAAKNLIIGKAATAPVIDGKDDEQVWKDATLFQGQTIGIGGTATFVRGNTDAQLSWKAAWDDTYLYTIIKAKDDVIIWNTAFKGWNIDAIEFYVTKDAIVNTLANSSLGRTTQANVLWQNMYLGSPEGSSIIEFRGSDNVTAPGAKTPVVGTTIGRSYDEASKTTTFEIRYEWTKIITGANAFTSVAVDDKIRIGMMWSDNDNPSVDNRDHKVFNIEKVEPSNNASHKDWAVVTLKNAPTGLKNTRNQSAIKIYPNPAKGEVNFSEPIDAEFYNIAGQQVLRLKNANKADISTLTKGIYQVKVNKSSSYKLVVE